MRYLYWAPAALLLGGVLGIPLAVSLPQASGGLGSVLSDAGFRAAAGNTFAFAVVSVALEVVLGLAAALVLDAVVRGRRLLRAAALLPWILPTAVMALSWRWIFNDLYGVANDLPMRLGLLDQGIAWLGRPSTAFWTLVVADVWKTTPFVALILLAGLQSIPGELHEAMALDGAGPSARFFRLTLPLLRPALAVAVVFRLIQALGIFDLVWVMTGGGPADSTKTVALYVYDQSFRYLDPSAAAAATAVAAAGAFGAALLAGRLVRGKEAA